MSEGSFTSLRRWAHGRRRRWSRTTPGPRRRRGCAFGFLAHLQSATASDQVLDRVASVVLSVPNGGAPQLMMVYGVDDR